jgi:peptidyl-prolyl cis-trans isomerase B (cyclophilin B)
LLWLTAGPGTNGSQFFLVFADTTLGPNYTIWGSITQGLDIVKAIAKAGVKGGGADGTPNQTIAINRVTVSNY